MRPNQEQIKEVILDTLKEEGVLTTVVPGDLAELKLLGQHALLKSVGLVSVLVGIEQRLAEQHDLNISLMDERAMSQTRSPFRNVQALLDYVVTLSEETGK